MPKIVITQKGIEHNGKALEVGTEMTVKEIPASFINKCQVVSGSKKTLEVATPEED